MLPSTDRASPARSPKFRPSATGSAATPSDWRIREVGDGNLNLVFIVEGPAGGVVVKQALPYVRLVGESLAAAARALMVRIQRARSSRRAMRRA